MIMTDEDLYKAFEEGRLDPKSFSHERHIHVAWLYVCRFERAEAIKRFASRLKSWATSLGIPGKYHETITWFFMLLIAERQTAQQASSFTEFIEANPDLTGKDPSILELYYKPETLKSGYARKNYVLPDNLKTAA